MRWYRDNQRLTDKSERVVITENALQIEMLEKADSGQYSCGIETSNGFHSSNPIGVTVQSSGFVTKPAGTGRAGSPLELICVPESGVAKWEVNGMTLNAGEHAERLSVKSDGTLVIDPLRKQDEQELQVTCIGQNSATHYVDINVIGE